jgi:hypothetical protein
MTSHTDQLITLHVSKAESITADQPVPDVAIFIDGELPDFEAPYLRGLPMLWRQQNYFNGEAQGIEAALHSLPGALYDQLLAQMLARKASNLLVPCHTANVSSAIVDVDESPRYQELLGEYERLDQILTAHIAQVEYLERRVCGSCARASHETTDGELSPWDHIFLHAALIKYQPQASDSWDARLAWLVEFQRAVNELVQSVFPDNLAQIKATLYRNVPEAVGAECAALGFQYDESGGSHWYMKSPAWDKGEIIVHFDARPTVAILTDDQSEVDALHEHEDELTRGTINDVIERAPAAIEEIKAVLDYDSDPTQGSPSN